uniref:Uncharacterized protein n=1 Tax=Rhizophora mucronata TaxID=61149 RepID=A0A2P2NIF5_RHIMU
MNRKFYLHMGFSFIHLRTVASSVQSYCFSHLRWFWFCAYRTKICLQISIHS